MYRQTVTYILFTGLLIGCAESGGINPRGWHFLSKYEETPDYKALVVTPSTRHDAYAMGIGQDSMSVEAAIDDAMQICEEGRTRVGAVPECRLHSVGDVEVRGMNEAELAAVIAQYKTRAQPAAAGASRPDPPREAVRLVNTGYSRARSGDYNGAIRDYTEAIRLAPEYIRAYFNRGSAYRHVGEYERAIADYTDAIRLDPEHARAYNNRCWTYALLRRAQEALADCDQSLRLEPDSAATLDSRALAYWLLGEQDKARQDLERARKLDPKTPYWRDRLRQFEAMF